MSFDVGTIEGIQMGVEAESGSSQDVLNQVFQDIGLEQRLIDHGALLERIIRLIGE